MEHRGRFAYSIEKGCIGMTNAQKIRAMSDEELAEFLIDLSDDGNLKIREWLQQPTGEEDKHEAD